MFWIHIHCCWKPKTATGKYDVMCKMKRLSPTGIKQFYKMSINTLSPPSIIRESNPFVSRFHTTYDLFRWLQQEFMRQIARRLEAAVILSLKLFVNFEYVTVSQISSTLFKRAFIENNARIPSDRESQRHCKVKIGALNYTHYKTSSFKNNHLV